MICGEGPIALCPAAPPSHCYEDSDPGIDGSRVGECAARTRSRERQRDAAGAARAAHAAPSEEYSAIYAKIQQLIIDQYVGRAVPDILYHYTDAAGLKGIVESGVLRATHISFMNDASESVHAGSLLLEHVQLEKARATNPLHLSVLGEMEKGIATRPEDVAPYFVVCFSAQENSLNQWRAYGRGEGGFSIGFDGHALAAQVIKDGRLGFIAPAIYDRGEQEKDDSGFPPLGVGGIPATGYEARRFGAGRASQRVDAHDALDARLRWAHDEESGLC
jgi:hypothetical protein